MQKAIDCGTSVDIGKHTETEPLLRNTRSQDTVIFAFDHLALDRDRYVNESRMLDPREGVHGKHLRGNAQRFFWGACGPGCGAVAAG